MCRKKCFSRLFVFGKEIFAWLRNFTLQSHIPGVGAGNTRNRAWIHPVADQKAQPKTSPSQSFLVTTSTSSWWKFEREKKRYPRIPLEAKEKGNCPRWSHKSCLRHAKREVPEAVVAERGAIAIPRGGIAAAEGICDPGLKRPEASLAGTAQRHSDHSEAVSHRWWSCAVLVLLYIGAALYCCCCWWWHLLDHIPGTRTYILSTTYLYRAIYQLYSTS